MNEAETTALSRVQIAAWLPASCAECGREYSDVDDFMSRDPRLGYGSARPITERFVDDACWSKYLMGGKR